MRIFGEVFFVVVVVVVVVVVHLPMNLDNSPSLNLRLSCGRNRNPKSAAKRRSVNCEGMQQKIGSTFAYHFFSINSQGTPVGDPSSFYLSV